MLGYLNNWNINKFTNKGTSSEDFNYIHKILLHGISDIMSSLVNTCNYGAINTTDTKKGYYVIKYVPEILTLQ